MLQTTTTQDQLDRIEEKLRDLRQQRGRAANLKASAVKAAKESGSEASVAHAKTAAEGLSAVELEIEATQTEQVGLLKQLGDQEQAGGFAWRGGNGWAEVARKIDLPAGLTRADVAAASLLRAQAPATAMGLRPRETPGAVAPAVGGPYYCYQSFTRADTAGGASITDFTISFSEPTVTGMERAPAAVTEKPVLAATYGLATPDVRQHAIVATGVPVRLLSAASFPAFLDSELRRQVDLSVDRHVVSQIEAASPPSGSSGTTMVEKVRNALTASRAYGSWPTVLLLSTTDSSALDLTTVGADGLFLFPIRDSGSSSPLFSLAVIESPAVTDPILVDPARAGVLYTGDGTVTVDNLSGLTTNEARIRTELEALLHVRCPEAAYVIA